MLFWISESHCSVLNPKEPILENLKAKQTTQQGEVARAQKEAISIEAYAQ